MAGETDPQIKFLLVDDDVHMRRLFMRSLFTVYQHAVYVEADSGVQAQEKLASFKPSLIILDFNMPELNGIRTCTRIRRDPAMNDVKILIVSAEPLPDLKEKALKAGADAFLAKPFLQTPFLELIDKLLKTPPRQ